MDMTTIMVMITVISRLMTDGLTKAYKNMGLKNTCIKCPINVTTTTVH